jgi:hypothetical protein
MMLGTAVDSLDAKEKRCKGPQDDPAIVWCSASPEIGFDKLAASLKRMMR